MKPPPHLSKPQQEFWRSVLDGWDLNPAELKVLAVACEALDRLEQARVALATDGPVLQGREGVKSSPWVTVERDARSAALRALRQLSLEAPALAPANRRHRSKDRVWPRAV
jgi:phage terminase small subunit